MRQHTAVKVEQEHHLKAFEMYYAQGEKRSLSRLASQLGVSVATTKSWARSFGWVRRIGERDATVARQVADEAITSAQQTQSRNRRLIELATTKLAKAMLNGQVKYQLADLDRLIRLQSFLDAEAGKAELTIDEMLDAFMTAWMALPTDERRRVITRMRTRESGTSDRSASRPPPRALPTPAIEPPTATVPPPESPMSGGIPK